MEAIIAISPEKIIYVSCNAATQARDLVLLTPYYSVEKAQPVDMFPFTSHVENIVELKKNINNSFTNN
jgi:23S rRNA (uracil1939-C5)-methyltransferase